MSATHTDHALAARLEKAGARYAMASYVDIHGRIKGKLVPLSHLGNMLGGSELYTVAALDGVPQDISDNEVAAMPDPASATQCPWNPELVWFASDLHLDGTLNNNGTLAITGTLAIGPTGRIHQPGTLTFHTTFSVSLQVSGSVSPSPSPSEAAPRN